MSATTGTLFERLYAIVKHLRGPEGCAWDRKQTASSLRTSLVEETYECVDAIDREDAANLREELGDLCMVASLIAVIEEELGDLCMVASLIAVIEEERGRLTMAEALEGVCEKLVRRHPHVFGDKREQDVGRILEQWQRIKQGENGKTKPASVIDGVPASLPPLERALGLQKKAAKVGFDWPDAAPVYEKLQEEIAETRAAAGDQAALEGEVGDLLFTVVNLARLLHVDPARALGVSNLKFETRFRELERRLEAGGREWKDVDLEEMDRIWDQIKAEG